MSGRNFFVSLGCFFLLVVMSSVISGSAFGHCDTFEGPVIQEARIALEAKDVAPLLKWVPPKDEALVRAMFETTLKERAKGPEAKEKIDGVFFEALIRMHREGEGVPFTGIKPAGTLPEEGVVAADEAIAAGSADGLISEITGGLARGIQERFDRVMEAKKHVNESVDAGRAYVAAYVEYTHYVENVHAALVAAAAHHQGKAAAGEEGAHRH